MPEITARIAAVVISTAFVWAAVAKLAGFARWRAILVRYGIAPRAIGAVSIAVPAAEIATGALVLFVDPRAGAAAACALLAMFSLAVLRARSINGDRVPCGCFGGSEARHYATMLIRNAFLGALAAVVLVSEGAEPVVLSAPQGSGWVAAGLVVAGGALVGWTAWQVSAALRHRGHP